MVCVEQELMGGLHNDPVKLEALHYMGFLLPMRFTVEV